MVEELKKSIRIGGATAPNRIAYQPTEANNCDADGSPTEETYTKYLNIAKGKPGIIHIESIDVSTRAQARSNRMTIQEHNVEPLKKLIGAIREVNDVSPIFFQLSHAGRLSDPQFKPPMFVYGDDPSAIMTTADVKETSQAFVDSARRAWEAGADGVDFKQAHGFIGDDFLHPANQRPDEYGGSFENRTRFFRETYHKMRDVIANPDFVIGTRISPYEGIMGGMGTTAPDSVVEDLSEVFEIVRLYEKEGFNFINVSAGYAAANLEILMPSETYPEGVLRIFDWTRRVKEQVSIPVIGSGYSYLRDGKNALAIADEEKKSLIAMAEYNIRTGGTDLIGVGRQSIADPEFARKVVEGKTADVRWCTACNGCGLLLGNNKGVGCTLYEPVFAQRYRELTR